MTYTHWEYIDCNLKLWGAAPIHEYCAYVQGLVYAHFGPLPPD